MDSSDSSLYVLESKAVSGYVMDFLGLKVGEQKRLIAIYRICSWKNEDPVMVAALAVKHACGCFFLRKFKFCYDEADRIVYCLAHEDQYSAFYRSCCVNVDRDTVTFYEVKSIVSRSNSFKAYLDILVRIKVICFAISFHMYLYSFFNF